MHMKGHAFPSPVVKELRLLCAAEDVEIDVVWKLSNQQVSVLRNNSLLNTGKSACASVLEWFRMHANKSSVCAQVADQWSKVEDNSEWVLHEEVFQELIQDPALQGRKPALDVFASSITTKVPEAFYSRYFCPETKGVDAMVQPWVLRGQAGSKQLVYINGPCQLMGPSVRKT